MGGGEGVRSGSTRTGTSTGTGTSTCPPCLKNPKPLRQDLELLGGFMNPLTPLNPDRMSFCNPIRTLVEPLALNAKDATTAWLPKFFWRVLGVGLGSQSFQAGLLEGNENPSDLRRMISRPACCSQEIRWAGTWPCEYPVCLFFPCQSVQQQERRVEPPRALNPRTSVMT